MADIMGSMSTAITLLSRLKRISDNIKDAEFSNLLAQLSIDLSEARVQCAALTEENAALKRRIREFEAVGGERCPKCRQAGWRLEDSKPDAIFGDMGVARRTYRCSDCGFSESKLVK
jgi:predicted RNA-binding Zn-ribbon protein involved in translation (DUF1610 family)